MNPVIPDAPTTRAVPARPPVGRAMLFGSASILIGIGGFSAWAATAPLASAVIAPGTLKVDSHRKTVQHDKGGIIAELLVRDGDRTREGQPLLRLDDVETRAQLLLLDGQHISLLAERSRLEAQRDGLPAVRFPDELARRRDEARVAPALDGQEHLFERERLALNGQIDILRQRVAELNAQIAAHQAGLSATDAQLALIREETRGVADLVDKGLEKRPRLLALQRAAAQLDGARAELLGKMSGARLSIGETDLQILGLRHEAQRKVATDLRETETKLSAVSEQLEAARAQQSRREIRAPQNGVVMNLAYFAPGAVVPPGGAILDVVPEGDQLMAEVRIQPSDVDSVREGQEAQVMLTSFQTGTTPRVDGTVSWVSADALTDDRTQASYYLARIRLEETSRAKLGDLRLSPGMPLEGFVVSTPRTMLEYLIQPLGNRFRRAFREE
ncbi:hypothetical protein N825_21650 [Skermanella stibiiresistens SB22]|uniref:Membrane fusion protein (MFP) family protein n=2 Tax=Skermanella TaxID=204447 RepID=W9GZY4_9PROT|nr:hypothetical protein N825_21650 [Skermanella stibiiresistens SB22]